ncbi:EamA family transporter [Aliamphritea hakodatensis]|uniref:EamA family transporter n=1 Tax=Aliamphritea hakodatensis TaxID=2895352 RepID=UPI0022FD9511|nr:EamA family transporter [Aliamphritea hakodatensis]
MHNSTARPALWWDIFLTAIAPVTWGSTYIVATELLPADRPLTAAMLRILPAGILLVCLCRHLPRKEEWWRLTILAALNLGLFQALLFIAAYRLPGGVAAVLGAIQPMFVILLCWGLAQQKPALITLLASITGVGGMAVLLLSPDAAWDNIGIAAALAGALSMACGTYLARQWRSQMPLLAFTGWQLLLAGLMLLPVSLLTEASLPALSPVQIGGYTYLCLIGAVLAYALWFRGISKLSPAAVSSLGLFSPLTAVVLGWTFLGQSISATGMAGFITVLISVYLMQNRPAKTPAAEPKTRTISDNPLAKTTA